MRKPTLSLLAVVLSTACGHAQRELTPEEKQELTPLAGELNRTKKSDALANRSRFAPLCDENGYPLVGNVLSKTSPETTVAEFCAEQTR
ncbi:MAG: hypothetical protein JNK82_01610 [Myxococcaceae bacterium]|nr:hypothetical protein [Myxococcaceae bacterium]